MLTWCKYVLKISIMDTHSNERYGQRRLLLLYFFIYSKVWQNFLTSNTINILGWYCLALCSFWVSNSRYSIDIDTRHSGSTAALLFWIELYLEEYPILSILFLNYALISICSLSPSFYTLYSFSIFYYHNSSCPFSELMYHDVSHLSISQL